MVKYGWVTITTPSTRHPCYGTWKGQMHTGWVVKPTKKEALAQYDHNDYWDIIAVRRIKFYG